MLGDLDRRRSRVDQGKVAQRPPAYAGPRSLRHRILLPRRRALSNHLVLMSQVSEHKKAAKMAAFFMLGDLDSNQDWRSQSPQSCRWTIPEYAGLL